MKIGTWYLTKQNDLFYAVELVSWANKVKNTVYVYLYPENSFEVIERKIFLYALKRIINSSQITLMTTEEVAKYLLKREQNNDVC